jgi:alkanesulfonate monooxygenase SsuD/methylene tetrahydromethanopterin reductase-like flavin-dependent oxidoreductase (luciferase family)
MANSQEAKMSQETRKIRFGLWYDFRNPAQWRQPADRLYREILDQIAWSENNGFDDVWLSEHHFIEDGYLPSILPAAAAIAARTNRIRIASGVLLMPFHNPIRLAEDVATVDVISGGRFELGVGIGFKREEFSGFGVSSKERGARTDQSLDLIRRALSGETVTLQERLLRLSEHQGDAGAYPETSPADLARRLYAGGAAPRGPLR